jgi:tRNA 2-thiouridine synthesizing protein A
MHRVDFILDTSGLVCPQPLLETKKIMTRMETGQTLQVILTDASSLIDFDSFVAVTGHQMLEKKRVEKHFILIIQKV